MINKEETLSVISFFIKLLLVVGAIRIVYDAKYVVLQLFAIFVLYIVTDIVTRLLRFIFIGGK
nr:MAG TPA: hypothetical protein [Caudoviricetes sp.]